MYARSFMAIGEAVIVPGPLPVQAAEPRPAAMRRLLSQPVAVTEAQGGKPDVDGWALAWP